jgi:protein involved in temperature-dependent protein secretion
LLARMMAKRAVQEQLRSEGVRVSLVRPAEISARVQVYLQSHPEVWREALERAHLFDEAEGQRKARQKLRRAELARRRLQPLMITPDRPVCRTENAKSATDNSG